MSIHGPARYLGAPQNVYSPDHPVGFYQKIQIVSNLRRLLERLPFSPANNVYLLFRKS